MIDRFETNFFEELDKLSEARAQSTLYSMSPLIGRDAFINPLSALALGCQKGSVVGDLGGLCDLSIHCKLPRVIVTPTRLLFFEPDMIQVRVSPMTIVLLKAPCITSMAKCA